MNRILDLRKKSAPSPGISPTPLPATLPQAPAPQRVSPPPPRAESQEAFAALSWRFSSRGNARSLGMLVGGLGLLTVAIVLLGQITLALVIGCAAIVFMLQATRHTTHEVQLSLQGIAIDQRMHAFKDIKSFWIHYIPGGIQELSIELKGWYLPYLHIPLSGKNPVRIREFLSEYLPEQEHPQSLVDVLLYRIGL